MTTFYSVAGAGFISPVGRNGPLEKLYNMPNFESKFTFLTFQS
jgi:hypothetical protein